MTSTPDESPVKKPMTLHRLQNMHHQKEKIATLTCYDAAFCKVVENSGMDCLLVGDSLGMVIQGHASTLPVTLNDMVYHTQCVARARSTAWLIADLPFGSYQASLEQALLSSISLMQAGAQMIKLEGGQWTPEIVYQLTRRGIAVCAHLGLTPQSVHALGGYRIQGKDERTAQILLNDVKELVEAGAAMMVLELIPSDLTQKIANDHPDLITIGIGAGPHCSGQVLVLHDMLGLNMGKVPRFVKNFMLGSQDIPTALENYVHEVKQGLFPHPQLHAY